MSTTQLSYPLRRSPDPAAALALAARASAAGTVVEVGGELELATMHRLTALVDDLTGTQPGLLLILDLSGVTFFCADGIRALLQVRDAVTAVAGRLVLRRPAPLVRKVLAITGDAERFEIQYAEA